MAPPESKMMPTGIGAYGGSITQDVYTNSIYGFSLHIPPGWVVVPVKTNLEKSAPGGALESHFQKTNAILIVTENAPLKKPYQRKSIQVMARTRWLSRELPLPKTISNIRRRLPNREGWE